MRRKLLVVDDEPDIIEGIVWALEHAWRIDAAGDGQAALSMLSQDDYAAALVDLNLPGADGGEVIRQLRLRVPGLPVLLVSASPEVDRVARVVGATGWLRKPFDVEQLEVLLEKAVSGA